MSLQVHEVVLSGDEVDGPGPGDAVDDDDEVVPISESPLS